ncbi:glycosyltransferase family 4 protein [Cognatilysobacter bugurensis]|uniref:Glycosyl transferase group 1 n=1 Tax=Cognatilysobacter bugurensis TaxID=543356 RepID=A0A918W7P5_9GAMM|nr:glycosyltransferase family 4 protein [Lysobacter bugurensis]GHA74682.1 glycosyl transferase group 1 [Lysobacter bugurensis]
MTDGPRLHVLMILDSSYPPLQGGGTEAQVRTLARGLRARGHRVTVFAPVVPPAGNGNVARVDGTPAFRLPFPNIHFIGGLWLMARLALFLYAHRHHYDVWHVHSPRRLGAVAALLGSRLRGPQVVVKVASATELETGTLSPKPNWIGRFQYFCLKRANAWQAISQRICRGIAARGIPADRIAAVPNACDVTRFRPSERASEGPIRFLYVGRLIRCKNLPRLLDAFAELLKTHPSAQLRIVGGGSQDAPLREHAARLNLQNRVEFTGHRNDVEALIADADIGVLPSLVEGLSNTLLECMASGLPMVASRISGSEDMVKPGVNGWLFDPEDTAGLTAALRAAADQTAAQRREYGVQARATIEQTCGLDSVLDRILTLYRGKRIPVNAAMSTAREGV